MGATVPGGKVKFFNIKRGFGYVNNHWAGHSPQSARELQRLLGQTPVTPDQLGEQFSLF